jgi:aconitate hydratase
MGRRTRPRCLEQNLANFGIVPLIFKDAADWNKFEQGDSLSFPHLRDRLKKDGSIEVLNRRTKQTHQLVHHLSGRQIEMILLGGLISLTRKRIAGDAISAHSSA